MAKQKKSVKKTSVPKKPAKQRAKTSASAGITKASKKGVAQCPKAAKPKMSLGEISEYGKLKGKTGDGLFDRDHQPSKGSLKKRAEHLKGGPLTAAEARKIENRAQAVAIPKNIHQAGPTYGGKNTPQLIKSDASDLAGAAKRDADEMLKNAKRLDSGNMPIYTQAAKRMKTGASSNKKIDNWLQGILDE